MLARRNSWAFPFWREYTGVAARTLPHQSWLTQIQKPHGISTSSVQDRAGQHTLLYQYHFLPHQKYDHSVRLTCVAMDVCWCLAKFLALCVLQVQNKLIPAVGHLKLLDEQCDAITQLMWGFQFLSWTINLVSDTHWISADKKKSADLDFALLCFVGCYSRLHQLGFHNINEKSFPHSFCHSNSSNLKQNTGWHLLNSKAKKQLELFICWI